MLIRADCRSERDVESRRNEIALNGTASVRFRCSALCHPIQIRLVIEELSRGGIESAGESLDSGSESGYIAQAAIG